MSSEIQNKAENLNNSIMVLTIDIGNGICDKLRIHDINNYQEETYDFCAKNNLDFNTMKEINHQIQNVLSDSGAIIDEITTKIPEEKPFYIRKNQNKLMKNNYLNNFKNALNKKKEIVSNKKAIKKPNEKPLNNTTQKIRDSNKSNNYSYLTSNLRGNSNSTKTSSIKEYNIKSNVKNAFHTLKGNSERNFDNKYNILKNNNNSTDIKSFRQNSDKLSGYLEEKNNLVSNEANSKVLYSYSHNRKNEENNKAIKKRKESIELLNKEESNKGRKDEMMIIEFDSNDNNNSNNNKEKYKNISSNEKFNNILNSISLIKKDFHRFNDSNSEKIIYRANKTESNEQRTNFTILTNKSDIDLKNKIHFNLFSFDQIKNFKKFKEEKIKNLKEQQEKQFKKLYTFRPLINHNINTETNQNNKDHKRTNTSSRFDRLYDYRISYKENKKKLSDKYTEKYTFQPKINSASSYPLTKMSFNERLKLYSNKSQIVIERLQKSVEKKRKSNEKNKLVLNTERPKNALKEIKETKKGFSKDKDNCKMKILHGKKNISKTKLLTDKNLEERNKTYRSKHVSSSVSIINNKKLKCFKNIFKLLDKDDNDGKISDKNMDLNYIPKDIKKILEPIFIELKNDNETLTESEFVFVCDKLYESLTYQQKQKLLEFEKDNKMHLLEKHVKDNNHISKTKTSPTLTTLSLEKGYKNLNRIASCETGYNKKKIKRNNEIKKINYYFSKPKYLMQINNFINEDKKIRENKNIINNISLATFLKNKNSEKNETNITNNTFNMSNLVVQNLNNKIDKEIKYRNNDLFGKF